jgi:tRNA(fMet)-specific endonuclease VapC
MSANRIRYVLDTDIVTYHQRNRPMIVTRLARLEPDQIATTAITLEEQLRGALAVIRQQQDLERLTRAYHLLQVISTYFCQVTVLPFDDAALAIYRGLVARKVRIGTRDLRIAAIVLASGATLVTGNRRHFDQVPELPIEDWNTP